MKHESQLPARIAEFTRKFLHRTRQPFAWLTGALVAATAPMSTGFAQDSAPPQKGYALSEVLLEVTRGPLVESRHYGRLVAVTPDGEIQRAVGDPQALILPRSALKPFQALATVRLAMELGVELASEEIAIMCSSHSGDPYHLEAVKALLERAQASEEQLHCGPEKGSRLRHNCSGKHSGMLVLARLSEIPANGYWEPGHLVQRRLRETIREFTSFDQPLRWGTDGCGVPNYAISLYSLALGYARLANPKTAPIEYQDAAAAIRDAMLAHPGHISSIGSFHAQLIESAHGNFIGKTGAEGCYGFGVSEPALGVAFKIEDGNTRGLHPLLLAALNRLGAMKEETQRALGWQSTLPITNSRDDVVGEIRVADW